MVVIVEAMQERKEAINLIENKENEKEERL